MLITSTRPVVRMSRKRMRYAMPHVYARSASAKCAQLMGMAMMANKKTLFVMLVDHAKQFEARSSQFFADFD